MKILLIGSLGKMGKTIAESVSNTDDEIVAGIDITSVYENGFETYDTIPKTLAHIDAINRYTQLIIINLQELYRITILLHQ